MGQPLLGKQLVFMTDASFQTAGYAVLIEDDLNHKYPSTRKTFSPIAYGSQTYTPSQTEWSIYAKKVLAFYLAFEQFGHIFRGVIKPVNTMTDSKSITRFYQTKMIPPYLWIAFDLVLIFNSTINFSDLSIACDLVLIFNSTLAHSRKNEHSSRFFISFRNGPY